MKREKLRSFNRAEKVGTLKLLIKLAASDNGLNHEGKEKIERFLEYNNLKINSEFVEKSVVEDVTSIIAVFSSKSNLDRLYNILENFAESFGINPDHKVKVFDEIKNRIEERKGEIRFSLGRFFKVIIDEFGYLYGKENIKPNVKRILAIIFTLLACMLGLYWTSPDFFGLGRETVAIYPTIMAVICGLFIYGALASRNYLSRPSNFENVILFVADVYLFSIISIYILGQWRIEKTVTLIIFFGLILLLWLGMKEILGFVLIGFLVVLIYKLTTIDLYTAWRASPFALFTILGLSFQSENFFDDLKNITSSFFKAPDIEKELVKESLE